MDSTELKRTDSTINNNVTESTPVQETSASMPVEEASSSADEKDMRQINLLDVDITDENTALNVIIGYLGVAQKRGTFAINESAKIYECVKKFAPN
jgi:hypothetical protein